MKCVENQYQGWLLARGFCEIAVSMTCDRKGSGMVPELWSKPVWEKVWAYLDPLDSVRPRTASTHWNVPGEYGPHGKLFFFLMKKEQVVASNEVLPNPHVSAETLKACALILFALAGGSQSPDLADMWTYGRPKRPDLEQPVFGKCHLW